MAKKIGTKTDNGYIINMIGNDNQAYDMVILRNNGFPTYNFCSILDDYDYDVTNIIRGVDHIANQSKQQVIWDLICKVDGDKPFPTITHAGLLFEGAKKLSKRSGNGTTDDYKDISTAAILNWLIKFGWSHPDPLFDKKYPTLSMQQMIDLFNDGNISDRNCKIDKAKLAFLDKRWKAIDRKTSGTQLFDAYAKN
jgi:glutamyl-tRNA synthetase